jgi:hypothetical protein
MEEISEDREIVARNNQARQTSLKQHLIQTLEVSFIFLRTYIGSYRFFLSLFLMLKYHTHDNVCS